MTRLSKTRSSISRGYTLNEMLIVLAVLATLAAMAWPALHKPLARQRLRAAARQLRGELAGARLEAIHSGKPLQLKYVPGAGTFRVEPLELLELVGPPDQQHSPFGRMADQIFDAPESETAMQGKEESEDSETAYVTEKELPQDVAFARRADSPDASSEFRETFPDDLVETTYEDQQEGGGSPTADWSEPIVFYPDGRTSNATLELVGDKEYRIQVELRGVTGSVSISPLRSAGESSQESFDADEPGSLTASGTP